MKNILLPLIILLSVLNSRAQTSNHNVIGSAGDYFTNPGFSVSWSLGECVTETFASTENILTQGFQQGNILV